ncbi:MAG: RNA methyltransferase [Bacteroidales bacterium]|jgi:tRNA G18 (ribose-2'-O)-methylase SpoU|nr:RNA methyltransferase [Bacteroidales bacterium]
MRKLKITELHRISIDEFKRANKIPLVIVLDNVRSLHNIGSIFRTADAFLVERVILCGISSTPPDAEIHKTALGAEYSVAWEYSESTVEAALSLKADGYCVFSLEQADKSFMLDEILLNKSKKYVIILGNEVHGVQQEVVDCCDACIEIPQYGTKHSLNVSIAGGIVIWTFFNQLKS